MENTVSLRGTIYGAELQKRTFAKGDNKGKPFIFGSVLVNCSNVGEPTNLVRAKVFLQKFKKSGEENQSFSMLEEIMNLGEEVNKTLIWVDCLGSLVTDDYINRDGQLVTFRTVNINYISRTEHEQPKAYAYFRGDFVATKFEVKKDDIGEYAEISGYTSNYTGQGFPISLSTREEDIVTFLEQQGIDENVPVLFNLESEFKTFRVQQEKKVLVGRSSGFGGTSSKKEIDIVAIYEMTAIGENDRFTFDTFQMLKDKRTEKIKSLSKNKTSASNKKKATVTKPKEEPKIEVPNLDEELPFKEDKGEKNSEVETNDFENWF